MSLEDEGEEVEGDFAPGDANGENSGDPFTPSATEEENIEVHRFNLYTRLHSFNDHLFRICIAQRKMLEMQICTNFTFHNFIFV